LSGISGNAVLPIDMSKRRAEARVTKARLCDTYRSSKQVGCAKRPASDFLNGNPNICRREKECDVYPNAAAGPPFVQKLQLSQPWTRNYG
jgi:hypothetical protein